MSWDVYFHDEFEAEFNELAEAVQIESLRTAIIDSLSSASDGNSDQEEMKNPKGQNSHNFMGTYFLVSNSNYSQKIILN